MAINKKTDHQNIKATLFKNNVTMTLSVIKKIFKYGTGKALRSNQHTCITDGNSVALPITSYTIFYFS